MSTCLLAFFNRPVLTVASALLGKVLVMKSSSTTLTPSLSLKREREISGVITEVEAYDGVQDKACHASKGCTDRTKVMFGPAGHWYVYLCYGMHWMLNVVCEREGYPAAILIRSIAEIPNSNVSSSDVGWLWRGGIVGPGKVTKYFGIDKRFNGKAAIQNSGLWIEDRGIVIPKKIIHRTSRIGVTYAGDWAAKPYRFICREPSLSSR